MIYEILTGEPFPLPDSNSKEPNAELNAAILKFTKQS